MRLGEWRIEESSQLLHLSTPNTEKRTPFEDPDITKTPITGIAVDPNSALTLQSDDRGVLVLGSSAGEINDATYQRLDAEEIDYPSVKKNGVQVLTVEDILDGGDIQLDDYQRLDAAEITYPGVVVEPQVGGVSFQVKRIDGTDLIKATTTEDENVLTYEKTL